MILKKKWNSEIDMITKMLQEAQAMYGQCGGKDWKGYTRCKASVILRPAPPQLTIVVSGVLTGVVTCSILVLMANLLHAYTGDQLNIY